MRRAVVDVGSNSVLLLVEEETLDAQNPWHVVLEKTWVSALGSGVRQTKLLSEPGIANTLDALKDAFNISKELGVSDIQAFATMAARMATNTNSFLVSAFEQGTPVTVLSGEDEADLGFEAVALDSKFMDETRLTIIDVGGQSTELVTATRNGSVLDLEFRKSFPIGSLALKGGVLKAECPTPTDILQAVVEIDDAIGLSYLRGMCGTAVVLGATGTNFVALREKMVHYDPVLVHGQWLDFGEISQRTCALMQISEEARRELPGMEPGRQATLPAGGLILERFLQAIGAPGCRVSVRGWRHALLERRFDSELSRVEAS